MANFPPLKKYICFCLGHVIDQYKLTDPFLDVGCGRGDISEYLGSLGWQGKAIDFSDTAIEEARSHLAGFQGIKVEKGSLGEAQGSFQTVLLMDVLEHIEDDDAALKKIHALLSGGGHLVLSIPSNPPEWRWDDDCYGHFRRYSPEEIQRKLIATGFVPLATWDLTYPVFWFMRRCFTRLKSPMRLVQTEKLIRGSLSSSVNAWESSYLSAFLSRDFLIWRLLYKIQFKYFRNRLRGGHEMVLVARKA